MLKSSVLLFVILTFALFPLSADAISTSAASAILIEADSGRIIYDKNAYRKMPMASTTKIMTAICAIENINTNIPITVPDEAVGIEGSSVYLEKGEVLTAKELLYSMMLNSGNDAATALAIEVSGSVKEFCKLMNSTAKNIGAKNTNFTNPSGLYDDSHYTTAYDLAIIASYALKNPLFAQIVSTQKLNLSKGENETRYLKNHNKLLWQYEGCTGVKTGYTKKCGRCLVTSAQRDGISLVAVTLNAPDDWRDHTAMLEYGFKNSNKKTIAAEGDYALTATVDGAYIPLYFENELKISAQLADKVVFDYELCTPKTLPLNSGEKLGMARIFWKGQSIASSALLCRDNITTAQKPGFGGRFYEFIKSFINM